MYMRSYILPEGVTSRHVNCVQKFSHFLLALSFTELCCC
jgi:hypothetical protein